MRDASPCDREPIGGRAILRVEPAQASDAAWIERLLRAHWGSPRIVTRGRVHDASALPAYVARDGDQRVGLATYRIDGSDCELVSLNSERDGAGVGGTLLAAVAAAARSAGCKRLWLITTNDNLPALRFYQKRGFRLLRIHRDALEASRRLKPSIPRIGMGGIELRDEIELEMRLDPPQDRPAR